MPFDSTDARAGLFSVLDALDTAGIPHFLTGALVRNLYAGARTSEDFDIVIDLQDRRPGDVQNALEAAGFHVEGPFRNEFGERLVIVAGGIETDLWLAAHTEAHLRDLEGLRSISYHGREIRAPSPEDFVLRKLHVYGRIRRRSTDLDDAYQVLVLQWDSIDVERLIRRAAAFRLEDLARELVEVAREDREAATRSEPAD